MFGAGFVAGNLIGGKLADRQLVPTALGSLIVLAIVLFAMTAAIHDRIAAVAFVGLLGAAALGTAAPLQMWVLERAAGAGQVIASSFNIGAFNLGNAIGAWLGGVVIDHGPGLGAVTFVAALMPLAAFAVALWNSRLDAAVAPADKTCGGR